MLIKLQHPRYVIGMYELMKRDRIAIGRIVAGHLKGDRVDVLEVAFGREDENDVLCGVDEGLVAGVLAVERDPLAGHFPFQVVVERPQLLVGVVELQRPLFEQLLGGVAGGLFALDLTAQDIQLGHGRRRFAELDDRHRTAEYEAHLRAVGGQALFGEGHVGVAEMRDGSFEQPPGQIAHTTW